jgi:DNA recombination-dependent growth factor C
LGWAAHTHAKFIFFVYKAKEVATLPLDWKEANHLHDDLLLKKKKLHDDLKKRSEEGNENENQKPKL